MDDKKNENIDEIGEKNIFDDFADDESLIDEVNEIKSRNNRDLFFYVQKAWFILQSIFWSAFTLLLIASLYIHLQNDVDLKDSNILDPFCSIILWDIENTETTYCSSVSYLENKYSIKLDSLKVFQKDAILDIIVDLYSFENFTKSKDILFLLDKTNNKLNVLEILEEFDNLKNEFNKLDKEKIQCSSIIIDSEDSIIDMKCEAYSAWFEKWIRWFEWDEKTTLKWTSISIANSFLNFINKKSEFFNLIDRQKVFQWTSSLSQDTDFTNKTVFNLSLEYNQN